MTIPLDVRWIRAAGQAVFITRAMAAISTSKVEAASPRARRPSRVRR
jgi:hypothetical protein